LKGTALLEITNFASHLIQDHLQIPADINSTVAT